MSPREPMLRVHHGSFSERLAAEAKQDVLETLTLTERLLVHILIELMDTRARRDHAAIAARLKTVGLSRKQIAALLDTTPASLAVTSRRAEVEGSDEHPEPEPER